MALGTSQYVRRHWITVARNAWGAAFAHAHNLNDGNDGAPSGYTPNVASIDRAFIIDAGGVYHAIESGVARISGVTATNVSVIVGENTAGAPALVAALTAALGAPPGSMVLEVTTRFVHSTEIGRLATGDEILAGLPLPPNLGLPISLSLASAPPATLSTIFVRTTGNDANDGTTVATAVLTFQEACTRIMRASPLRQSVLVDSGPGVFAGDWQLSGVETVNGANIYFIGNAPGAAATDKTSLSGGAATLTTTRDWMGGTLLRWTGDAAWGVGAPAATDLGRTVRISDATHVMYATVANVGTGGALATQYVDLIANPAILGVAAVPAWLAVAGVVPAGVTLRICDPTAAAQVTEITGNVYIADIRSTSGSPEQPSPETGKHNLLGHLRFDTGTVVLENADRFAFHGTRFETGFTATDCRDCTSNAVTVPQAAQARFWPAAIWTRLGYSHSSSNEAWGGAGFLVAGALNITRSSGTWSGLVTANNTAVTIGDGCKMTFVGVSHASTQPFALTTTSQGTFSYMRSAGPITSLGMGRIYSQDFVSFLADSVAADDTVANAPVNYNGGLFSINFGSDAIVILGAGTRIEGRNSQGAGQPGGGRVAVSLNSNSRLSWLGSTDGNFYGDGGWIRDLNGSTAYIDGAIVFPSKLASAGAQDIVVESGSTLRSRGGTWSHAVADTLPGMLVSVQSASSWVHGDPAAAGAGTDLYVVGNGAGAGIDCGNGPVILAASGSYVQIGKPRVSNTNAGGASRALALTRASHARVGSGGGANDAYLLSGAATNVNYGDATIASPNPLVAAFASDIAGAGNPQGCTYEIV